MPRKVRILTTSFARSPARTVDENRDLAREYLRAAGPERADLVCLPENFLLTNVRRYPADQAEPLDGPTFAALSAEARAHRTWVVGSCLIRQETGEITNTALLIDRAGTLAGTYAKVHPTIEETRHVTPGTEATVVDTDFGRLGLAICFDVGWPSHWENLKRAGAELVVWPSAYDGGFPLQAYAWLHQYHVVSSVRTAHSKVVDITGKVLASTSEWHRLVATTIDLDKKVFHIDRQVDKILRIQQELGCRVSLEAYSEENVFTLLSNDPHLSLEQIEKDYALEDHVRYHQRSTEVQQQRRATLEPAGDERGPGPA